MNRKRDLRFPPFLDIATVPNRLSNLLPSSFEGWSALLYGLCFGLPVPSPGLASRLTIPPPPTSPATQLDSIMDGLAAAMAASADDGSLSAAINDDATAPGSELLPGSVAVTSSEKVTRTEQVDPEKANLNAAIATIQQMLEVHAALRLRVRGTAKPWLRFFLLPSYCMLWARRQ